MLQNRLAKVEKPITEKPYWLMSLIYAAARRWFLMIVRILRLLATLTGIVVFWRYGNTGIPGIGGPGCCTTLVAWRSWRASLCTPSVRQGVATTKRTRQQLGLFVKSPPYGTEHLPEFRTSAQDALDKPDSKNQRKIERRNKKEKQASEKDRLDMDKRRHDCRPENESGLFQIQSSLIKVKKPSMNATKMTFMSETINQVYLCV